MIDIEEYILLSKEERQKHLRLDEACIERGGQSMYCKGLLAHILDTTIPSGKKIYVCHACHNAKCSHPYHLYWGTPSENRQDEIDNGGITIWERTVAKHGLEVAKDKNKRNGNTNGSGNKGNPKSEEHKRKIAANRKGGRKKNALVA
ncbi:MAG: hypothetical protein K2X37_00690 [Chitinophagaceae bacterium]|nr:hypothetical protein [Chitinophagaceae bacterium]